jgi:hypothetical protein
LLIFNQASFVECVQHLVFEFVFIAAAMSNQSAVNAKLASLLKSCEHGTGIVAGCKQLISFLLEERVAYRLTVPSLLVGVHPTNRDGYGVNPHDMHDLMDDIFSLGWDTSKVSALCVELDPTDKSICGFNEQLVMGCKGMLAPVDVGQLRYASLWGGHTNQILRAVQCAVEHSNPDMTTEGRLDLAKIEQKDREFAKAVREGLSWIVLPSHLFKTHTGLAEFLQAAGNASGQVSKPEHELQLLRKIHNCYLTLQSTSPEGRVSYDVLKARVLRSKPPCAASLPGMYSFVLRHAGGPSAKLLLETEAFIKARASTNVTLSPDVWSALAADVKARDQMSFFRHGMLKAMYLLHDSKCIQVSDVKRIGAKDWMPKVLLADGIMKDVRSLVMGANLPQHLLVETLGVMDIEMVMFTMGKLHSSVQSFASMGGIAHKAVLAINAVAADTPVTSQWQADAAEVAQPVAGSKPDNKSCPMREFDQTGGMVNPNLPLIESGFNVGVDVRRVKDKLSGTISVLGEPTSIVTQTGDVLSVSVNELLRMWKRVDKAAEAEEEDVVADFQNCVADRSQPFRVLVHKQQIILQMHQLTVKYPIAADKLKVVIKPKNVIVTAAFKKHDLVIVPVALKVDWKNTNMKDECVPSLAVDVGFKDGVRYWLSSSNQIPNPKKNFTGFVSPFWLIASSASKEDCNMELHFVKDHSIPVARNTVALKVGEALVLYRPDKTVESPQQKKHRSS